MADRQERRLMRQRGAGTRELKGATFGFTFGGAPPLQPEPSSRRTPRALAPRLSSRRTPNPLPPRPSSRKTPATPSSQLRSTRRQRSASVVTSVGRARQRSASVVASNTGRTSEDELHESAQTPGRTSQRPFSTPSVAGKIRRGQTSLKPLQEDEQDELERNDEEHTASTHKRRISISRRSTGKNQVVKIPLTDAEDASDELEQDDQAHQVSSGQRRSEGPQITRSAAREQSETGKDSSEANASPSVRETRAGTNNRQRNSLAQQPKKGGESSRRVTKGVATAEEEQTYEMPTQQQQMSHEGARRHRTPVDAAQKQTQPLLKANTSNPDSTEQQAPKRRHTKSALADQHEEEDAASADELSPVNRQIINRVRKPTEPGKAAPQKRSAHGESDDDLSPEKHSWHHQRRRPEPTTSSQGEDTEEEAEEEAEDDPPQAHRTRPALAPKSLNSHNSTPKRARPSTTRTKRPATGPDTTAPAPKRRKRRSSSSAPTPSVPVTVYRLTNPRPATTADENDDDTDPLQLPPPDPRTTRLPGVNPVDVLAQLTSELITLTSTRLSRRLAPSSTTASKETARALSHISAFQSHLSDALLTLTTALDTSSALSSRLKATLKQKYALRDEFLGLRARRDELALRVDGLRATHAARKGKWEQQRRLEDAVWDVDVAVKRGRERARGREGPVWGVEELVGEVKGRVCKGESGGLVERVREFSAVLEGCVGALGKRG